VNLKGMIVKDAAARCFVRLEENDVRLGAAGCFGVGGSLGLC